MVILQFGPSWDEFLLFCKAKIRIVSFDLKRIFRLFTQLTVKELPQRFAQLSQDFS
jgi:hypothetical protein